MAKSTSRPRSSKRATAATLRGYHAAERGPQFYYALWQERALDLWLNFQESVDRHRDKLQLLFDAIPESQLASIMILIGFFAFLLTMYIVSALTSPAALKTFAQVLGWVGSEMLWLILFWGLVAVIGYYALNHLATPTVEGQYTKANDGQQNASSASHSAGVSNEWANEVVAWMYNNFHKVPSPLEAWIKSLNDAAKKVTTPTKCEVLFEGFGDHSQVMQPPKISDVRVEKGPRDHLTIRSHVHLPCTRLKLVSSQRTPERMIVSNFDASIVDLRGEVECRIACIANQLYVMGCFNGRPEMDIELVNTDPTAQAQVSLGLVEESIRRCLLSAVTNINLSESTAKAVDGDAWRNNDHVAEAFNRNAYANHMPHVNGHASPQANGDPYTVSYSSSPRPQSPNRNVPAMFKKLNDSHLISPATNSANVPNKLRVNVLKASKLGMIGDVSEVQQPYVVIEMDEPAQKFSTGRGLNHSPYWEEIFDFNLTPASEEILFEVYEGNGKVPVEDDRNFLGLSIVNFEEIKRSGENIHTLRLQGRPYRKDDVTGDLTIQFEFYYDPNTTVPGVLTDEVRVKRNGAEFRETVTTQRRAIYDPHDNFDINDITPTRTTTVVVKTTSQQLKEKPTIQSVHGSMENAVDPATQKIIDQHYRDYNDGKLKELEKKLQQAHDHGGTLPTRTSSFNPYSEEAVHMRRANSVDASPAITTQDDRKSRDRGRNGQQKTKRDRSFFSELKDRLTGRRKSQKRSKSMDLDAAEIEEAVSVPPSRDQSRTRYAFGSGERFVETQSVGGRSGESSKSLYQHSTLVLELPEGKQNKYFLIPPSVLTEPASGRLIKNGKKLHIYNEHTFVAVKIKGGVNCNVCQDRIRASFSKQAYQCRDCKMVCHKSCHYKTDAFCTNSKLSTLHIAKDVDWAHFLSHYELEEFISAEGV